MESAFQEKIAGVYCFIHFIMIIYLNFEWHARYLCCFRPIFGNGALSLLCRDLLKGLYCTRARGTLRSRHQGLRQDTGGDFSECKSYIALDFFPANRG